MDTDYLGFAWEEDDGKGAMMQQQEQEQPHTFLNTWYTSSMEIASGSASARIMTPGRPFSPSVLLHLNDSSRATSGQSTALNTGFSSATWSARQSMAEELLSQRTARESARESVRQSVRESLSRRRRLSQRASERGHKREYLYGAPPQELADHVALHTEIHIERQKQAHWTHHVHWDALDYKRMIGRENSGGADTINMHVEPHRLPPPQSTAPASAAASSSNAQGSGDEWRREAAQHEEQQLPLESKEDRRHKEGSTIPDRRVTVKPASKGWKDADYRVSPHDRGRPTVTKRSPSLEPPRKGWKDADFSLLGESPESAANERLRANDAFRLSAKASKQARGKTLASPASDDQSMRLRPWLSRETKELEPPPAASPSGSSPSFDICAQIRDSLNACTSCIQSFRIMAQ